MSENLVAPENQNAQGKKNSPHKQVSSEKQKTPTWAIVLIAVLFGLLLSLVIWIITHKVDSIDLGMTITPENWFSFLVTLIGILITLFVGFQIFSVVDVQRDLKDTRKMNEKLKTQTEEALNNIRKENMAFAKEQNDFQLKMLEKQNNVAQKVDWDLKEVKKEYWKEIVNMKETVKNTEQTQTNIETKMGGINEKWEDILKTQEAFSQKMSDFKHDLANAFLQISKTFDDDNFLRVLTGLKSMNLREEFSGENIDTLIRILDNLIGILEKNNTKVTNIRDNIVQETHDLRSLTIDPTDKKYCEVQEKIYKIARLAEQLPAPQEKDEKYSR